MRGTDVVLATTTGAGDHNLRNFNEFDWVVIDEAAQGLEAACWIAIQKGKKVLFNSQLFINIRDYCYYNTIIHFFNYDYISY